MTYFHAILQAVLFCAVLAAVVWMFWLALELSTGKVKKSWSGVVKGLLLEQPSALALGLPDSSLRMHPQPVGWAR
jgi:hypothetical protein